MNAIQLGGFILTLLIFGRVYWRLLMTREVAIMGLIHHLLLYGPSRPGDVAGVDHTERTVARLLRRMVKRGVAVRTPDGRYDVPPAARKQFGPPLSDKQARTLWAYKQAAF